MKFVSVFLLSYMLYNLNQKPIIHINVYNGKAKKETTYKRENTDTVYRYIVRMDSIIINNK